LQNGLAIGKFNLSFELDHILETVCWVELDTIAAVRSILATHPSCDSQKLCNLRPHRKVLEPQVMPYLGAFGASALATTWQPGKPLLAGEDTRQLSRSLRLYGDNWLGEFAPRDVGLFAKTAPDETSIPFTFLSMLFIGMLTLLKSAAVSASGVVQRVGGRAGSLGTIEGAVFALFGLVIASHCPVRHRDSMKNEY